MVNPVNIPLQTLRRSVVHTEIVLEEERSSSFWKRRRIQLSIFFIVCVCDVLYLLRDRYVPWYKTATLYEVDIGTFKDSNGDGIGDLKGLISKVEYLERLNIKTLILSSFYKSEGDGIVNHKDIHYTYGTQDDFRELIKQFEKKGIRLIIDFNPNHTSNKHPWFQASIKGLEPFDDFYIWSNSTSDEERMPPSNWLNVHGNSAWTWNEERKQFYFSTFGKHLPDLNLRNPLVRNELKDIITYWMKEKVDGFKVVASSHLVENAYLLNEPVLSLNKPKKFEDLDHTFTIDQYENLDLFAEWKQIINCYSTKKVLIAEVSGPLHKSEIYYGNKTFPLASLVYNTHFTELNENVTGTKLRTHFASWASDVPSYGWPAWMIRSKTEPMLESRDQDLLDGMDKVFMIAKGTLIICSGGEFGVSNILCEDNVEISMKRESHLHVFKKLLAVRNDYVLIHGIQQYPIVTDEVFSLMRYYDSRGFLAVLNLSNDSTILDFTDTSTEIPSKATLLFQSGHFANSSLSYKEQQEVPLNNVYLGPKQSALFSFGPSVNVRG